QHGWNSWKGLRETVGKRHSPAGCAGRWVGGGDGAGRCSERGGGHEGPPCRLINANIFPSRWEKSRSSSTGPPVSSAATREGASLDFRGSACYKAPPHARVPERASVSRGAHGISCGNSRPVRPRGGL